jgi:hypothetical protein
MSATHSGRPPKLYFIRSRDQNPFFTDVILPPTPNPLLGPMYTVASEICQPEVFTVITKGKSNRKVDLPI